MRARFVLPLLCACGPAGPGASGDDATTSTTSTTAVSSSTTPGASTSEGDTTGVTTTAVDDSTTGTVEPPWPPPSTPTVFPTAEQRVDNWTPAGPWEMEWDASASAAELPRPFHTWFDNPHDDDLDAEPSTRGACRYRFDDPAVGMMTVDRVNTPTGELCPLSATGWGGRRFTGNVWIRDEYLSAAAGLTLEVDLEIPNRHIQIQDEAFSMLAVLPHGSFAVYLSPDCLKIGRIRVPDEATRHGCASTADVSARALNTEGQHRYRMTLPPDSLTVTMYVDDDPVPFLVADGTALPFVRTYAPGEAPTPGDTEYEHPTILIGDNTGSSLAAVESNTDVSAVYVLDGIRWTRGVFAAGQEPVVPNADDGPLRRRWPPPLPANVAVAGPGLELDAPLPVVDGAWLRVLSGDAAETFVIGTMDGDTFVPNDAPPPGTGVLSIDSESGAYLHEHLDGLIGNDAWMIEARIKVGPATTERAFALNVWDQIGMINVLLSPDKVELGLGGKHRGVSDPIELDTTDDFHTYRLARAQNDHRVFLFVDDLERPVVADFSMSGVQMNGPYRPIETRLWIGNIGHLFPTDWVQLPDGEYAGVVDARMELLIDHIRWVGALAPGDPL